MDTRLGLVAYECGCIGLPPVEGKDEVTLICCCDGERELTLLTGRRSRSPGLATFEKLSDDSDAEWCKELAALIRDGYAARRIKSTLSCIG